MPSTVINPARKPDIERSGVFIGMTAIQSPYTIEAIGDKSALAEAMGKKKLASLYDSFKEAGIYPQVSKSNSITLEAAVTGEVKYAERNE